MRGYSSCDSFYWMWEVLGIWGGEGFIELNVIIGDRKLGVWIFVFRVSLCKEDEIKEKRKKIWGVFILCFVFCILGLVSF